MSAPPLLCAALEIALNRYLTLEPDVLADVAKLEGRVIALRMTGTSWEFFLAPHRGGVQVLDASPKDPQVRITARPVALMQRLMGQEGGSGVDVSGDAELLAKFSALLAKVGFDPEEWLAKVVGDGAAHRVAEGLRGLLGWGRNAASTLALDTAEYLREETRDLAHRADVERWSEEVERMRDRVASLAARIDRLERQRA